MTRNEYLIDLLMESADALMESAGRNGAGKKFYDNRIKNIDNKINSLSRKAAMYKRAGYADKGPAAELDKLKGKRKDNLYYRDAYDTKRSSFMDERKDAAEASRDGYYGNDGHAGSYGDYYYNKNELTKKQKALHKRINDRAKNEAIDILAEATDIMYGEY